MPSRIDIGPDGGPYVAINENSNDFELQDINGNVMAKWDETAGQWDFKANDLANVGGIDADEPTYTADVGELQSTLDVSSPGDVVKLRSGKTFDPGSQTTVPLGVTLLGQNARIEPSSDYNVLFLDNGASAFVDIDVSPSGGDLASYTSTMVELDTTKSTNGAYRAGGNEGDGAQFHGRLDGIVDAGTGVHLNDSAGVGITIGTNISGTIARCGTGLLIEGGGSNAYVNFSTGPLVFESGVDMVKTTGTFSAAALDIKGTLQPATATERGINNAAGVDAAPNLRGHIWDSGRFNSNALSGVGIHVETPYPREAALNIWNNATQEDGQIVDGGDATFAYGQGFVLGNLSSDQSVTSATWETVNFGDNVTYNEGNEFDAANNRLIPNRNARYRITAKLRSTGGSSGDRKLLRLNDTGGGFARSLATENATEPGDLLSGTWVGRLFAGNNYVIEFRNENTNCTIDSDIDNTQLSVELLSGQP